MHSPTFQFSRDDFERLIWDAALDPHAKVIALAIRWHMHHKTRACNPSVARLAQMCGIRDERTIKRYIKDIARVLAVEIISEPGKAHTFKLKVFQTADEIAAMLAQEEWRRSHWLLFKRDELENAVSQFRDALAGEQPATSHVPPPPASDVPPASHVPPTSHSADPLHPMHHPPTWDVPRTSINLYRTYNTSNAPHSALNGRTHRPKRTPQKGVRKASPPIVYSQDFEEFWSAYRALMQQAGGKAATNRNQMAKADTFTAWDGLTDNERAAAKASLPAYAHDAGQYMRYASKYLAGRIFDNYAEAEAQRADVKATLVAEYLAQKRPWDRDMIDACGDPPGHPNCTLPAELIDRAQVLARGMLNGAGAYHG